MTETKVKERDIVVPGDVLAESMDYIPGDGTYRKDQTIYAKRMGLLNLKGRAMSVIPVSGAYIPKEGDTIIGKVTDIALHGWFVDTNSAYRAMLSMKEGSTDFIKKGSDLSQYFAVGDYILTKITNVTTQFAVDLTMNSRGLMKLEGGRVFNVDCNKVPRIIGKAGSMISMIKSKCDCRIYVGQNGVVWIDGEPKNEILAIKAIRKIEKEAHTSGLTQRIEEYLDEELN